MSARVLSRDSRRFQTHAAGTATIDVLCVGFTALDILVTECIHSHRAGGTAANVAADLAWLGRRSAVVARLGADPVGEVLCADLAKTGVDTTAVEFEPTVETPLVVHSVSVNGGHQFLFNCPKCDRVFPRHRSPSMEGALKHWSRLRPGVLFYDRASAAAVRLADETRRAGGLVMFEPSTAGRVSLTREAVRTAHIVKVSEDRANALGGVLDNVAPGQVQVVTKAAQGLRWRIGRQDWNLSPAFVAARMVDGAGAGDWTTAGFLTAMLAEKDSRGAGSGLVELLTEEAVVTGALRFGQALAAVSVGYLGARGMSDERSRGRVMRQVGSMAEVPSLTGGMTGSSLGRIQAAGCEACLGPLTTVT